jgi:pyruvate dehydrogenase (quinone)
VAVSLQLLNQRLEPKADHAFIDVARKGMERWRRMMKEAEAKDSVPLKPQRIVKAFGDRMPKNAILATDSGQNTELAARHIDIKQGQAFAVSGALASMACGLPYAIAAGIAFPGRPIFAVVGDGGLAMQLGEFSTAVRYRLPLKVLVIKNGMLNQIAWEQMMFLGNPQFACELQPIDFAMAAEAMGGIGYSVSRPEEIDGVLDAALATDGPVIIEAVVDAYEPMMPPRMPDEYRKNMRKALPETAGHSEIEANLREEPLKTMMG